MIILLMFICFGFVLLIKGADYLVDGASSVAKKLNISNLFIGLTIVSFGTSAPELFVNVISSFKGATQITIGNILGSNIVNTLLILGLSAIIYPLYVTKGTVWKEIPLNLLAIIVLGILINDKIIDFYHDSCLSKSDGLILLCFFSIFITYTFTIVKNDPSLNKSDYKSFSIYKSIFYIFLGFAALFIGGKLVVDNAIVIAERFHLNQTLIGLTIVAIGTSLPELVTSVVASYKKNSDIAVGNVIGSNIFNIFFILGISAFINPLPFQLQYNVDICVLLISGLFIFIFMFTGGKRRIDRWEGIIFVLFYIIYLLYIIIRN